MDPGVVFIPPIGSDDLNGRLRITSKTQLAPGLRFHPAHLVSIAFLVLLLNTLQSLAQALVPPPITSSGLNTRVSGPTTLPNGRVNYDITGGTRPGNGSNLFHSFGNFNVPTNNIANFLNDSGLATTNILGRVTGGNISNIFGTIQTTGFGNANLFLMNPAGFLFGPTATVNVGGMVTFTSADYLRLADGVKFNAAPGPADALISIAPVAAFGFLTSTPGPITLQGSNLQVQPGQAISLIGGDIQLQGAQLSAPSGLVQIASVASPGEVVLGPPGLVLDPLNISSFSTLGRIDLQSSAIDVSGSATVPVGGAILIRGGQFVMENSLLQSVTAALDGGPISITAGSVQMKGGQIQTASLGGGSGGNITLQTSTLSLQDGAVINADTRGAGKAGNISVDVGTATLDAGSRITSSTVGAGPAGDITVQATDSLMLTGETPQPVTIGGVTFPHVPSTITSAAFADGQGGRITVSAPLLTMQKGVIGAQAFFGSGNAGEVVVNAGRLVLTDGALITATTSGSGDGGSVMVRATDSVSIDGQRMDQIPSGNTTLTNALSGIFTNTYGTGKGGAISVSSPILTMGEVQGGGGIGANTFGPGNAGSIMVEVGSLNMTNGAQISGTTLGTGQGGNVTVTATDSISISGRLPGSFGIGSLLFKNNQSGIVSLTLAEGKAGRISISAADLSLHDEGTISAATGGAGAAGAVVVNSGTLSLTSGGQISSSSGIRVGDQFFLGNGTGGTVTVTSTGTATIAGLGSGLFTSSSGNGTGGNINLAASQVQLMDGASISAKSFGLGRAGNILITAGTNFTAQNSSVTTEAAQASGGAIKITTNPAGGVQLTNSTISASVLDGTGGGGSVNIDPQFVLLQNSQILANAVFGPGGNISITTNLLLPDSTSVISASSQFGQQGTVTIQSPIAPASGKIVPLGQTPLVPTSLLSQRCAAMAAGGQYSSFVVAGRDALPVEPGGWLGRPLTTVIAAADLSARSQGHTLTPTVGQGENDPIVSVRQLPRSNRATQIFSTAWTVGCGS